jgi:hypothetical protein
MTKTAVVSKDAKGPPGVCELAQLYVNGDHIGYAKLETAYIPIVLDALKAAGFVIIAT